MDVLRTAVSMLALRSHCRGQVPGSQSEEGDETGSQIATIVTSFDRLRNGKESIPGDQRLGHAANFLYTLTGKKP